MPTELPFEVREYRPEDEAGITALLDAHMAGDDSWPPRYVREQGAPNQWLAERSSVGRWVAMRSGEIIASVGAGPIDPGPRADIWMAELGCRQERLAEIGRLVVHPDVRRQGVSELLTRRCVRGTVDKGYVPVATAFEDADASVAMMTSLGWRIIGEVLGKRSHRIILLLVAPARLRDAALAVPW